MAPARIATRTPRDLEGSGWYDTLPPAPDTPPLEHSLNTDWLIVGAGFAGTHATRRLLQHDSKADLVLLEAQDIGFGACGRNSGFMIDLPHELQSDNYEAQASGSSHEIALNRKAIDFAGNCAEEFGLEAFFQRTGKLHGAADVPGTEALSAFCQGLDTLKEHYRTLDADDMHSVTGSRFYRSGIHTPGCAMLQPAGYIRGLVRGMRAKHPSLRVYAHSPALQIKPQTGGFQVSTPNGRINTKRIILTVNGHLESFGWYKHRLMHVFTFASMTEALSTTQRAALGGQASWGLVSAHPMGTTVRRTIDHRIVIRNTFTYNPNMQTTDTQVARLGRRHDRAFSQRFPQLSCVTMAHRWGGHLCLSRQSTPVFGELEPGLYAACCHNGLGTAKGTLGGLSIADLACGHRTEAVEALSFAEPPARLLPSFAMTPVARTYLAWTQWRAGNN